MVSCEYLNCIIEEPGFDDYGSTVEAIVQQAGPNDAGGDDLFGKEGFTENALVLTLSMAL